jgi:hypothetical protein
MSGDHRSLFKDNFCAVAADGECNCGNDYKKNCKPSPPWKSSYDFTWTNKKLGSRQQSYAPHHIVCVASVGTLIVQASGKKVDGIVRKTTWCVNTKTNMIAMPLWGHTVQWYCNVDEETLKSASRGAPSFENIPQHDWDHTGTGCYIKELEEFIIKLVKDMRKADHDATTSDLAGELDDLSDDFREKLEDRGLRGSPKGTHEGWKKGRANPKSNWYLPFSMAADGPASRKGFPKLTFTNMVMKKLKWLAAQL